MSRKNNAEPTWIRTAQHSRMLTKGLTIDIAGWAFESGTGRRSKKESTELLKRIVRLITDREPERSLLDSAREPFPFFVPGLVRGPIRPQRKWEQIENWVSHWPAPVRRQARRLGVGSGELPTWRKIQRYFDALGFEALPVLGYVGAPLYSYFLSRRQVPVCTQWVMRYREAPYYYVPTDTFHDIGHGLAMAMPDYAELLVRFARASLQSGRLQSHWLSHHYGRLFEHSYVLRPDASAEPIGAAPIVFETLKVARGKLRPLVKDPARLRQQKTGYRPFASREQWVAEVTRFIDRLWDKLGDKLGR